MHDRTDCEPHGLREAVVRTIKQAIASSRSVMFPVLARAEAAEAGLASAIAAIEFAIEIDDHYDRIEFLKAWSEGDTSEWPEFADAPPAEGRAD